MYVYIHTYNKEIEKEIDLIFLLVGVGLLHHFFPDDFGEVDRETVTATTTHVRERDHGAMTTHVLWQRQRQRDKSYETSCHKRQVIRDKSYETS